MPRKVTFYRPTLADLPTATAVSDSNRDEESTLAAPEAETPAQAPEAAFDTEPVQVQEISAPAATLEAELTAPKEAEVEPAPVDDGLVTAFELEGRKKKSAGMRPEVVTTTPQLSRPMTFTYQPSGRMAAAAATAQSAPATTVVGEPASIAATVREIKAAASQQSSATLSDHQGVTRDTHQPVQPAKKALPGKNSAYKAGKARMKKVIPDRVILIIIAAILVLVIGYAAILSLTGTNQSGSSPTAGPSAAAQIERVAVAEAKTLVDAGQAVLVDTRGADYYNRQHIQGAISLPEDQVADLMDTLPKDKVLILYCTRSDEATSARVAQDLIGSGFSASTTKVLLGGYAAWVDAGYPVDIPD